MAQLYKLKARVWLYPGESAAWHFVNIDKQVSAELKERLGSKARGFGSLRVVVKLGKTEWKTSIFPDKRSLTYLLPLKAEVRRKERVDEGDVIQFSITL